MVNFSNVKAIEIPEGTVKIILSNGAILWQLDEGGLPSEYQEVEYIQSDGNQYIDTGINGGSTAEYEIKMDGLGSLAHSYEQYFAGDMYTSTSIGKLYASNSKLYFQGLPNPNQGYTNFGSIYNGIYELKVTMADGIVCNNIFYRDYTTGATWGTLTFWVFNSHSEPSLGASMRLYYLKMYTDGVKVRDYVPCYRKSDGVIGLYDLVSNTFFINQGSGSFTKGGDV